MRCKSSIFIAFLLLSTFSCTAIAESPKLCNDKVTSSLEVYTPTDIKYDINETAAIIEDGKYVGYLKVNFVQKLGAWDWFNNSAMSQDVRSSLAFNITIHFEQNLRDHSGVLIKPTLLLKNEEGSVIGKSTKLGWSGFSKNIILYGEQQDTTMELVIQPTVAQLPEKVTVVVFLEEDGHLYQDMEFDTTGLGSLRQSAAIRNAQDPVQITSANGAQYTFSVDSVTLSDNKFLQNGGRTPTEKQLVYDVKMRIRYDRAPTNSEITTRFMKDNTMDTSLLFGVQSDIDATVLYESNDSLLSKKAQYSVDDWGRQYFDNYYFEEYANLIKELRVGEMAEVTFNRVVPDPSKVSVSSARVIFEFPEEIKAGTLSKDFTGRYVIYEMPVIKEEELIVDE